MHWRLKHKGKRECIENSGGKTLSYDANQGIRILEIDGYAFKDINGNGELDVFEDWRCPLSERIKDFVGKYHLYQKEGILYYPHGKLILPMEFYEEFESVHVRRLIMQLDESEDVFYIMEHSMIAVFILMMDNDYGVKKGGYLLDVLLRGMKLKVLENMAYTIVEVLQGYLSIAYNS